MALIWQIPAAFIFIGGPGITTMVWLPLHMSVGVAILWVVIIRLVWRASERRPPRQGTRLLRAVAALVQTCLYALIVAVVITGWLAYRPMPLMPPALLFGWWPVLPAPRFGSWSARDIAAVHRSLVSVFVGLVGLHVAAAARHGLVLRDGVVGAMGFRRSQAMPSPGAKIADRPTGLGSGGGPTGSGR
jgi:cytochrome b561